MSENILDKYSKRILNGAINGTSISAQKIQQNIESISQIDSDFKNTINGLKKEKSKQIEIMFENVLIPELKKRNIAFYGGKVKVEKINYKLLLKYFPIELMAPQKGRFVVEKLIEKLIEKTSKKELSTAEKDDAVNFVYILCLCIQLHILGMGYYWITYNCPIHKETLHFIDYDATFEFGKPDEMLIGYDGYVWKNRKDFCVPSGIPGQHDFCCKCDIIPSYSNSSIEDWERKKREHQKRIEEKERNCEIITLWFKIIHTNGSIFC